MGISPFSTFSQICVARRVFLRSLKPPHSERFRSLRPCFTSPASHHEIGATSLYHGHIVSFEWQSLQERASIASMSGGTFTDAFSVFCASVGGFVFAGR